MNIALFLEKLTTLYTDWGTTAMQPQTNSFGKILEQVKQPTTANFLQLLSAAAEYLEAGETIAEIGCLGGANLIGILTEHSDRLAYGVDFFSTEDEVVEKNIELLQANLEEFGVLERVCFAHQTVEDFFVDLQKAGMEDRFGLYIYNFAIDYRQVLMSLLLARDFWADQALIIVSNSDRSQVQQAVSDFLKCEPSAKVLLDWQTTTDQVFGSHGLNIIAWDRQNHLEDIPTVIIKEIYPALPTQSNNNFLSDNTKKKVLHVGCGPYDPEALPLELRTEELQEIRLDIDPRMKPDILGTITDLSAVEDNSVDAVYSSHNLEHIYDYEVPIALAEFKRVLKSSGLVWLVVPDMQLAAEWVVKGDMDDQPLYISPGGPVKALWMFYGAGTSIPGIPYMAHKTGFTASSLQNQLIKAGFTDLHISRREFSIYAKARKSE